MDRGTLLAVYARVALMGQRQGREKSHTALFLTTEDIAVLLMCALYFQLARRMGACRRLAEENWEYV